MIQKILFDCFDGRATSLERKLIEDWLKEDVENETLYYQYLDEWESQNPQYLSDDQEAWQKFQTVLNTPLSPSQESATTKKTAAKHATVRSLRKFWYVAASLAILMTTSMFFLQKTILYRTYKTPYAQTQQLTLSDGTEVVLNANSTLYVPRWGQFEQNRKVLLDGEAEFHVTHTIDNQRFVVKTSSDFEVEVFGTKFVLYAREQAKKVVLNEGKVQVNYQGGKKQLMKPGDVVTLTTGAQTLDLSKTDDTKKYSAWKEHQFYFDDTSLSQASITIKEHFGLQLAFETPALTERRLSGYFKAEKSTEFFQALSILLNVDVRQQGDTIYLSTKH